MTNKPTHYLIDSGNTYFKVATVNKNEILEIEKFSFPEELSLNNTLPGLFCSVNKSNPFDNLVDINDVKEQINFATDYGKSLGIDRQVLIYDILRESNVQDTVILDAGSFITLDFINHKKHSGGYIFQGLDNFLKVYDTNGKNLPSISINSALETSQKEGLPTNTNEAITMSFKVYIESILNLIPKDMKVIVTGGNAEVFFKLIKNDQALLRKNFLFEALNNIYLNVVNQ